MATPSTTEVPTGRIRLVRKNAPPEPISATVHEWRVRFSTRRQLPGKCRGNRLCRLPLLLAEIRPRASESR